MRSELSTHENLWLQSQQLYDRVLKYWENPPKPILVRVPVTKTRR